MTRMTREFSLVLLGAGVLTAGYFFWPEEDVKAKADEKMGQQVAGTRMRHGYVPIFIHTGRWGGGASPATGAVSRGGFGSTGRGMTGIS